MKGAWLVRLWLEVVLGRAEVREAISFALARVRPKPLDISWGGTMFPQADHVLWSLVADVYLNRVYTPPGMTIRPGDVVVDIGAHKGAFCGYAARNTERRVVAFEPHPGNYLYLVDFLRLNGFTHVNSHSLAVGAKSGTTKLFLASGDSRHSTTGYDYLTGKELEKAIEVPVVTLEEALRELDNIDLLKVDCEGAEKDIFLSASSETLGKIRKLAMEIHGGRETSDVRALVATLRRHFSRVDIRRGPSSLLGYLFAWA